jgi:hypothetical protein
MALFEAPASHEANHYSHPYSNPEYENEWEMPEASYYSNPEYENEWEMQEATHYSNPYSNPEYENEWEMQEATHYSNPYSNPEYENEWEMPEASYYSNPEHEWETNLEDEGEYFFKKVLRFAKKLAPKLAGKLAGMIPGVGLVAGPLAAKLTGALIREGEMEAVQMEAQFFGMNEAEAEVANTEIAHEAALTEVLAAQAAEATTEAEAEAAIAATLPITITIMGGRRALRPMMPVMAQATGQLTRMMRQQGPAGKQLLRTVPTIQRQAVSTLKAAAKSGQPLNSATAVKAMAAATNRVLSNPNRVQKAIVRNGVLRQRTAPPNPRRSSESCPTCAARRTAVR